MIAAPIQRQKFIATGGIVSRKARPMTQFPDQKSEARMQGRKGSTAAQRLPRWTRSCRPATCGSLFSMRRSMSSNHRHGNQRRRMADRRMKSGNRRWRLAGTTIKLALNPQQRSANIKLKPAEATATLLYITRRMAAPNISVEEI
jgi:hypothetical protein